MSTLTNELRICVKFKGDPIIYELIERILDGHHLGFRFYPENKHREAVAQGQYKICHRFPTIREAIIDAIGWDPSNPDPKLTLRQLRDPNLNWIEINGIKVTDFRFLNFQ